MIGSAINSNKLTVSAKFFDEVEQRVGVKVEMRKPGRPTQLRQVFPSLDNFKYRGKWWVIDIGGNKLWLIAFIEFRDNRRYVKHICSHAEYDRLTDKYRRNNE